MVGVAADIHVKAVRLTALSDRALELRSHDFH
jgi:hypothetical protein